MSHKPIEAEINAAFDVWHDPHLGTMTHALTAANTLRDWRIRNEALEEAETIIQKQWEQAHCLTDGHDIAGQQLLRGLALAVETIRALKDKEPSYE